MSGGTLAAMTLKVAVPPTQLTWACGEAVMNRGGMVSSASELTACPKALLTSTE